MSADLVYRRVPVSIWTELAGLSVDAIVLALRVRTGPESTPIPGVVVAGRAGLAEALGWPVRRLDVAARELERRGIVRVDWSSRLVWTPAALTETPPANPNMVLGWRSTLAQVPACSLRHDIVRALRSSVKSRGVAYLQALETAIGSEPSREPSPEPSREPLPQPLGEQEGEGDRGRGGRRGNRSLPPVEDPDPYFEALRGGYREIRHAELPPSDARELERALAALRALGDPEIAAEVARAFYAAAGERPGDAYWREHGWSLHLLATQGVRALATRAQDFVAERRREAREERAARDRQEVEAAVAENARRREDAELAALPPVIRAWRLALRDVGGRVGALLEGVPAELAGDRLVVHVPAQDLGLATSRARELEQALSRHADGPAPTLALEAAA